MDLTTAEVYVAAKLANDEALMNVFRSGGNFHSTIANNSIQTSLRCREKSQSYTPTQRQAAKAVTFGIMYGAGPKRLVNKLLKILEPTLASKRQKKLLMTILSLSTN